MESQRKHMVAFLLLCIMPILAFNVQPVHANSTIYIRADGSIDPQTTSIWTTENVTYSFASNVNGEIVVEKSNILINGAGYLIEGNGAGSGFYLYNVVNVTITEVEIRNFGVGIYLESSSHNSIYGNNVSSNLYDGVDIYFASEHNRIFENTVAANEWYGVGIFFSNNNMILQNTITDSSQGIVVLGDSTNTTISMNNISNSEYGMGIYSSSGNKIAHNSFLANSQHVYAEYSTNEWDDGYPSGGNYWSDYNATDSNQDGICDSAYVLDANNQDRYPLMEPFMRRLLRTDINKDGKVNILDIGMVAKSYGTKSEDPKWNPDADMDKNGRIDILDIAMVAKDFGKTA